MDKSPENPEEDTVSLRSNEETPSNGGVKLGMLQSLRTSIRRVAEKSPLSSGRKGSKVTTADESRLQVPPSPSLSADSPVMSPLKTIEDQCLFQSTQDNQSNINLQKGKSLSRSKTDPNISAFGDSLIKKGASIRRSLTFRKNRSTRGQLITVSEGSAEDRKEERQEEEEEGEEVKEEMEESYTLPEIPHTPLSVMQINKLIEMEVLEEAHLNLLALRHEFQQQQARCGEDSPMELAKKEKDLNLLYSELRNKINAIVRNSNSLPSRNKGLLVPVARIIQEEERRVEEPGGLQGGWMETWREAVGEGVKVKVESIHLECKDQNASWLAVHLGLLGKAIVEDLEKVKRELRWSYPPSFNVFSTYVRSYHKVVGQHLKKLEPQVTELKDLHALLDWIINRYRSERIMGSVSLQPDMKDETVALQLEDDLLKQLKDKYCCRVKEDMRSSLDRLIQLENEEFWTHSRIPEKDDNGFFNSQVHMDVWTKVKGNIVNTRLIDAELEQEVISCCLIELKEFPKRFETEFRHLCSAVRPQPLWTQYHITYINSFTALQEHMDVYKDTSPQEVRAFRKEAECLIIRLIQELEEQFKEEVKPYLRRMMTRKWLTNDEDFKQLSSRTETLSQHCALMRPPYVQGFADRMHHHVVREYVGQLMKTNYSCKNRKHEKAASKMRVQCGQLRDLFDDMKSSCEWLHAVGDDLSDLIGQKNKADIKNYLQPLVEHYPDFSRKHLVAVLYFRGLVRGREHQLILQRLTELKKKEGSGDRSQVLFGDMQVTINTDCLSNLPFSCLSVLLPDN
ncbi:exocyst complex component 3-like protein 4 isoform X2 [Epinephelus fuscoguttatus]|uniref:exocyst complex component 3-like protein 4 isoform X2 n=1 Tax=Epinephelus fuscoguttatus TaxID=293821 RepID=UPI0020D16E41|nr:exocyst complex component 3-like protein 4 isoform X2 [Epinephelus fuscoguttatus]